MRKIFNISLAALLLCTLSAPVLTGCSEEEKVPVASYISLLSNNEEISEFTLPMAANHRMIAVRSDADWTATSDQEWLSISNHEGYGYGADSSFYVRIDVPKNESSRRTGVVTFASGDITRTLTISQKGSDMDPGDPFESSTKVVENIVLGYNLGNTLDSDPDLAASSWWNPTSDLDWETVWGQPKTTQAIIDSIAVKGFNIIRIPVTWFPHMDENWQVRDIWMDRVQEVVDYVMQANCYCILNVQHDSGARNGRTDGGGWLSAKPDEYAENTVKFQSLWKQIATRFKDYDQRLLFEAFNEILDGNDTWGDPADAGCYETITKLEQDFVNTVRATGGNNEWRNLVINTYSAGTTPAKLAGFQVPEDLHSNHLLASVHSYDPYNFCNDNGEWNVYVWDNSCTAEVDDFTQRVDTRFSELGIPYIYGEFGAIDEKKDMGERVKYAQYVTSKMKQYNTTGLWWMGLFNRRTKKWNEPEIVNALFNGIGK